MIDPSIALNIKPPQYADPLEQAGRAMNLLAARQQIQMMPIRMQAAQQELEQNRLGIQKAQTALDEEKAFKEALGRGAKPAELLQIAPTLAVPHFKQLLDQRKAELEQAKQQTQLFSSSLGAVKYASPEQQPAQYAAVRQGLIQQGVIKPEDAPEQYDPNFVDQHFRAAIDADKQVDEQGKALDRQQRILEAAPKTAKEWMDMVAREGSATRSQAELDQTREQLAALGVPKDLLARSLPAMWSQPAMDQLATSGMTPAERATRQIQQQQANTAAKNAENNVTEAELAWRSRNDPDPQRRAAADAALRRLDQSRLASRPVTTINAAIPGMVIGAGGQNQTTGEEYLKTIPASIGAQVRAIAEGRAQIPSASARSQAAQQIRDAVFRYDPSFSEQRAQVRKAFTTGPDGKNIGALNTAIVHLGRLGDTAEALQNGSFTPSNELYNYFKDKFGSSAVTNFALLKDAVAGEMAAALKGTATDIEIGKMGASIRAANSPEQMRGVIQEGMGILNDKANTFSERYHREMPDDPWSPILPSAQSQLQKHGIAAKTPGAGGGRSGGKKPLSEIFK